MYTRELTKEIIIGLSYSPAVAILGPRQIGKTTLALEIAKTTPSIYLDLENAQDFQKLQDPSHYLGLHADKLVILDEVQRYPDLFMTLRGIIDKRREEGRGNGRFLLLGSASNQLMRQSETLAGRIHYLELCGLSPYEIENTHTATLQKLWMRGGFPSSYDMQNDDQSNQWRANFITTYLERDIPMLANQRIPSTTLRRFWTMLAHLQGQPLNASIIASSLGVSSVTVARYVDMMCDLLLVRRLMPWHGNIKKRLVKSPRVYVRDSGIVHNLLQIPNYETLLGHPILGKSWEGFVIENIISILPWRVLPFFYRTSNGTEIDLLLEFGLNDHWAIEIKSSRLPKIEKGFYSACEDLKVKRRFVIYTGQEQFSMHGGITVLSLLQFINELKMRTESTH